MTSWALIKRENFKFEVSKFYNFLFLLLWFSPLSSAVCPLPYPDLLWSFRYFTLNILHSQLLKLWHLRAPSPRLFIILIPFPVYFVFKEFLYEKFSLLNWNPGLWGLLTDVSSLWPNRNAVQGIQPWVSGSQSQTQGIL